MAKNYFSKSKQLYTEHVQPITNDSWFVVEQYKHWPTGLVIICNDKATADSLASDKLFSSYRRDTFYEVLSWKEMNQLF